MSECEACAAARVSYPSGLQFAGCIGCKARAVAESQAHSEAYTAQKYTPGYMAMLHAVFGDDWQAGHQAVREWSSVIAAQKAKV